MITFFTKCSVVNTSQKRVYITEVKVFLTYDRSAGGVPGTRIWFSIPGSKFTPEEVDRVYVYDNAAKNIKQLALPVLLDNGEYVAFFKKTELLIEQKMIENFNTICPDRLNKQITLREFFKNCMNGDVMGMDEYETYTILSQNDKDIKREPYEILFKMKLWVEISTSEGTDFHSKDNTIYIVKRK